MRINDIKSSDFYVNKKRKKYIIKAFFSFLFFFIFVYLNVKINKYNFIIRSDDLNKHQKYARNLRDANKGS